jgi:hypothetical protein
LFKYLFERSMRGQCRGLCRRYLGYCVPDPWNVSTIIGQLAIQNLPNRWITYSTIGSRSPNHHRNRHAVCKHRAALAQRLAERSHFTQELVLFYERRAEKTVFNKEWS